MSVSAEMYIVISLMFAVFAAVAAIGTSVVLGVGFERLRAGFEIVKKQTGFFADAIHQLDERTKTFEEKNAAMKASVADMSTRVERVEKQTGFFSDAIHSIEQKILEGGVPHTAEPKVKPPVQKKEEEPILPKDIDWGMTAEAARLLKERENVQEDVPVVSETKMPGGISAAFLNYLRSEDRSGPTKEIVYH